MPDPPPSPHPLSYASPAPPAARQSKVGIISFVCGIIAVFSPCVALMLGNRAPGSTPAMTPVISVLIQTVYVCVVLLGLVTGIFGILPQRKRGLAIMGLALNAVVSLFILLMIVGSRSAFKN
jgi:hypothetical protein